MASTAHELAPSSNPTSRGSRTLLLVVVILALTVAIAVAWQRLAASPTATGSSPVASSLDELAPYRPGGSVYDSQVPEAARRTSPDELAPYRPGGSVYDSQVPEAARTTSP